MEEIHHSKIKFNPGRLVATLGALDQIDPVSMQIAIHRHLTGDWGDVCPEDREENERSLREGCRLLSVYHDRKGVKFWIITEWDRSATTVLLPDEY